MINHIVSNAVSVCIIEGNEYGPKIGADMSNSTVLSFLPSSSNATYVSLCLSFNFLGGYGMFFFFLIIAKVLGWQPSNTFAGYLHVELRDVASNEKLFGSYFPVQVHH